MKITFDSEELKNETLEELKVIVGMIRLWLQAVEDLIRPLETIEAVKRDIEEVFGGELDIEEQLDPIKFIDEEE